MNERYIGTSFTRDSDLRITRPGTDMTIRDVQWDAHPFNRGAPYYGLRLTRFFEQQPNWGVALDFTHYKMYAKTDRTVSVDGTWKGAAVGGSAPMERYVQHFEISHSENTVDNVSHETGYQSSGFGYQLLGGAQYRLTDRVNAFVEAKFDSGTAEVDIANGRAETPLRTFHALAGVSYRF